MSKRPSTASKAKTRTAARRPKPLAAKRISGRATATGAAATKPPPAKADRTKPGDRKAPSPSATRPEPARPKVAKPNPASRSGPKPSTSGAEKSPPAASVAAAARPSRSAKPATVKRSADPSRPEPADAPQGAGGAPGPRMQQILQAEIAPWRRDSVNDEEEQLKELRSIPVRNLFDSEEARRRLVDRTMSPGKKRFSRSRATSGS